MLFRSKDRVELVEKWYLPRRGKIVTDIGRMGPEQVMNVVTELQKIVESDLSNYGHMTGDGVDAVHGWIQTILHGGVHYQPFWGDYDLHPAMVKPLLALAGKDAAKPPALSTTLRWVPLLARFHQRGEAPELSRLAADDSTPTAIRWICLLAIHRSGEDLSLILLRRLIREDKTAEGRVAGMLVLSRLEPTNAKNPILVESLEDDDIVVRSSAVRAMSESKVTVLPRTVPLLERMLHDPRLADANTADYALELIASVRTAEAKQAVASCLAKCLANKNEHARLGWVLKCFETATGQKWLEKDSRDHDEHRRIAAIALQWWERNRAEK